MFNQNQPSRFWDNCFIIHIHHTHTSKVVSNQPYDTIDSASLSQLQKVDVSGYFRSLNTIIVRTTLVNFYECILLERLFSREYFMLDLILCMLPMCE